LIFEEKGEEGEGGGGRRRRNIYRGVDIKE
jgi:hypothetical protein